ncbi:unnamed protein product [Owenia fusiformis]|uniref:ADP-sugar pyrophosphatase n=1 Tax=Owenia fusiformis TaxID=6347 RepID=A0A8J1T6T7_OWEFU|nr:unnamed protein product [Owenia fusiformis]
MRKQVIRKCYELVNGILESKKCNIRGHIRQYSKRGIRDKVENIEVMAGENEKDFEICSSPPRPSFKITTPSEFVKEETVASGNWLSLQKLTYKDPTGKAREWEAVSRTTRGSGALDAVVVMATLKRTLKYDCIVLVKQYRPPMKTYTIEFPAGLIDSGEDPKETAVRELKEETGYHADIKHISPAVCLDPGLSSCTVALVSAEIDGDSHVNLHPQSNPDSTEFIEVLTVPLNELLDTLNVHANQGSVIDARVYTYAVAQAQALKEHKLEPWVGLNKS